MKPITVQDQVRLGSGRCLALCMSGMSYRMFRSLITVAILALAVAFLAHVLSYSLMDQNTRVRAYEELRRYRLLGQWITRLTTADRPQEVVEQLAQGDPHRLDEYQRWGGLDAARLASLEQTADRLVMLQRRLDALPPAARTTVLGDLDPFAAVLAMRRRETFDNVLQKISDLRLRMPGLVAEDLWEFVGPRQIELLDDVEKIRHGQQAAIAQVRAAGSGASPARILSSPSEQVVTWLAAAGFAMDMETAALLRTQAQRLEDLQNLRPLLEILPIRAAVARELAVNPKELDQARVIAWLNGPQRAQWLVDTIAQHTRDGGQLTADRLLALAEAQREQQRLQRIVGDTTPHVSTGVFDLPTRTRWLVLVSFLVCAIGVVNAMMMSVAERFTEIATMKCLGALDGFLLKMFFYEAMIQGFIGGLVGVALGVVLAVLRGLAALGPMVLGSIPFADVLSAAGLSLLAGIVLGAVAAIGPAWTAARLPPMEAMRVD